MISFLNLLSIWKKIIIKFYIIIFFYIKLYLESFKYSSIINLAKSPLHLKSSSFYYIIILFLYVII